MFETAEVGHHIDKETYAAEVPLLRTALLDAQFDLVQSRKFPVVLVIGGVDGAGKGETVNLLTEWLDPKHIQVHGFGAPSDEEAERPPMWRFWRALPPSGKMGIFCGSWYTDPILERVLGAQGELRLDHTIEGINHFERMLADEGALVLKFWFHLSKKAQKKRLEKLEADPVTRWRVTKADWKHFKRYDKFRDASARVVRETSLSHAPWIVVEGEDARYRSLTVGKTLLAALRARLDMPATAATATAPAPVPAIDHRTVLDRIDLQRRMDRADYQTQLEALQGRLALLTREAKFAKKGVIAVFEGWDAAGKGGAIRRITAALDARRYEVIPIAAPSEEERKHPYLWRFWRGLPAHGRVTIFDRSWYGRVLVERVEGFCSQDDWLRAYGEINDFEQQLAENNTVLCKFWLHVSKDEQLRRFEERKQAEFKRFKITDEDWRNREKWDAYVQAVGDLVDRTSTEHAPWTLVAAEDKLVARIQVLETLCDRLEAVL